MGTADSRLHTPAPGEKKSLADRLRAAVALLEEIVADRALLADIDADDRNRLLQAAGHVSRPDVIDRRRLLKASKRKRKADRVNREETILASVHKTHRVVIVEEGWPRASVGTDLVELIQREAFDALDAPVGRVSGLDVNMAYAAALEAATQPSVERILVAVNQVLYR